MTKYCLKCNFRTNLTYCPNCGDNEKYELSDKELSDKAKKSLKDSVKLN